MLSWVVIGLLVSGVSPPTTVAVLPLQKGAGGPAYDGLGTALAGMITTDLSSVPTLQLVERQRLVDLFAEMKLAKTGFLEKATAQKLGRGLGAKMLVMGSFSVVGEKFVIDTRLVAVETGAVVKAASSTGEVGEFVAVEKDVVEKLLDGLTVKLSLAKKRKILIATPTEDFSAMASYGRGLVATDGGDVTAAKKAFEAALTRDPSFALASRALAGLATQTDRLQRDDRARVISARDRAVEVALDQLADERKRGPKFRDTPESMLDFVLRQELLRSAGRTCQRFEELRHLFVRTKGTFDPFYAKLPGKTHYQRWRAGEDRLVARAAALGLVGDDEKPYGRSGRELMSLAARDRSSGAAMLLSHGLSPEVSHATLVSMLIDCYPPGARLAIYEDLAKKVRTWPWIDDSLWTQQGVEKVTVTVRDGLDLTWAYLRADTQGVDAQVRLRTDAVLRRHPEGDEFRRRILSRIQDVVEAGEAFERHRATRHGMSEAELLGATRALIDSSADVLRVDDPICGPIIELEQQRAKSALETYEEKKGSTNRLFRSQGVDRLGGPLAPLILVGCHRSSRAAPDVRKLETQAAAALERRHPGTLDVTGCDTEIAEVKKYVADGLEAPTPKLTAGRVLNTMNRVYNLRVRRCLVAEP